MYFLNDFFVIRLVAEVNLEKKMKSQKPKAKSSEGRKQFSSVRVIQRNLVYIVGLPLNLADEHVFTIWPCPFFSPLFLGISVITVVVFNNNFTSWLLFSQCILVGSPA